MICSKCKKVIPNGSVQCPECGADLKSSIQKTKAKTGCMWAFIILAFAIISVALIISVTNDSSPDSSGKSTTTTAAQVILDK